MARRSLEIPRPDGAVLSMAELDTALRSGVGAAKMWRPMACTGCTPTRNTPPDDRHAAVRAGAIRGEGCERCHGTGCGPQQRMLVRREFEMLFGGAKGGSKSAGGMIFLVTGDPYAPNFTGELPNLYAMSYVYHPRYRGTVLRRNKDDLDAWTEDARRLYGEAFGAEWMPASGQFRFPSGAKIVCGHLADELAYTKYTGVETHRIVIEEANHIPSKKLYNEIRTCCRSSYAELRPQMLLTANPVGAGLPWLKSYFVDPAPPETPIEEVTTDPFTGKSHKTSRIFIPAWLTDNPFLPPAYAANLLSIDDPNLRRAYYDGDWSAMTGVYFSDFRSKPLESEKHLGSPCHVTPGRKLQPWWHRVSACDWGYTHEAAFGWGCHCADDDTLHIYRELTASQTDAVSMGAEYARLTKPDLEAIPSHSITLHLSHEAFGRRQDSRSIAELIGEGIERVLGRNAVSIPELEIVEGVDAQLAEIRRTKRMGVTIRRARTDRVIGWQLVRSLMNWRQRVDPNRQSVDLATAMTIFRERGIAAYEEYVRAFANVKLEKLPKLQIWDACPRLIAAIPQAVYKEGTEDIDPAHFFGLDSLDCLRYLAMGYRSDQELEPYDAYREKRLTELTRDQDYSVSDLIWANRQIESDWKGRAVGKPFSLTRQARQQRRPVIH